MLRSLPEIEQRTRDVMRAGAREETAHAAASRSSSEVTDEVDGFSPEAKRQFFDVIDKVPMAYQKTNAIFATPEKKTPGGGGVFSIFVSDLCKGCAACVTACGDHEALQDGAGDRGRERGARDRHRVPGPAARHAAEVPGPLQRRAAAGLEDRHAAQHADGAPQLRRAGVGRRRLRRLRREEHPARRSRRSPRRTCVRSITRRPIGCAAKADRAREGRRRRSWRS